MPDVMGGPVKVGLPGGNFTRDTSAVIIASLILGRKLIQISQGPACSANMCGAPSFTTLTEQSIVSLENDVIWHPTTQFEIIVVTSSLQ